jgi:hypothetical protein
MLCPIIPIERESQKSSVTERKPTLSGVVSLLDMLRFYGDLFVQSLTSIISWEVKCSRISPQTPMTQPQAVEIYSHIGVLATDLAVHGLKSAALKCGRIHERLETHRMNISYGDMTSMLRELRERMEDDMHIVVFLCLSQDESALYDDPGKDWDAVIGRFHKMRHDIEESSKCFALARYSAAIFHVLLVAEFGIIKVAELFGAAGDRPGWGALDRLQRINDKKWNDKTPLEQEHAEFLKNLLPLAFAIKDSWRHKISHVDNKLEWMDTDFSPQVAGEIISATRGFMRRLAADLPK